MISLNVQSPEKLSYSGDGSLSIVEIWYTIQGEGPLVGKPAFFIRLAGCNLQCPDCDTDYTSNRRIILPEDVIRQLVQLRNNTNTGLVVITGGEPFRQNLTPLVQELLQMDFLVQIETNGTLFYEDFPWIGVEVVCSPKTEKVHGHLQPYVAALKYVVEAGKVDPIDGLPISVLGKECHVQRPWPGYKRQIFVQPLDQQNQVANDNNVNEALHSCLKFGYRFSAQVHKMVHMK